MNLQHLKDIAPLGGKAVVKKYGGEYMREIGRRGAQTFHKRYALKPVGLNNFAIVNRETGIIVNTLQRVWQPSPPKKDQVN